MGKITGAVVVAVDFGDEHWENTVRHGGELARDMAQPLHLVNVVAPSHWLLRKVLDEDSVAAHEQSQMTAHSDHLEEARGLVPDGVGVTVEVRIGKPAIEVLAAVKERKAGLLVVGHGHPSTTALILGGTADRLLRLSPIPVFLTGPRPPGPVSKVLVPTGLGPGGEFALATGMAQARGGEVVALYMTALPSVMRAYSGDVLRLRRELAATARDELAAHVAKVAPDGGVTPVLRTDLDANTQGAVILEEARERGVDVICLALGGRALSHGLLIGRVSEKVMRALPCSMLALPDSWIRAPKS
jgi:nucleotide-binding universal stress UspA family protein